MASVTTVTLIQLKSADGQLFEIEKDIAKGTMLEGMEDNPDNEPILIDQVSGGTLKQVIVWLEKHKDDPPLPEDEKELKKRFENLDSWDQNFLKVPQGTLFEYILAANYLNIKGLLEITCQEVANMVKGKTTEEIRKILRIKNDLTPEEEERLRKENEWCEA